MRVKNVGLQLYESLAIIPVFNIGYEGMDSSRVILIDCASLMHFKNKSNKAIFPLKFYLYKFLKNNLKSFYIQFQFLYYAHNLLKSALNAIKTRGKDTRSCTETPFAQPSKIFNDITNVSWAKFLIVHK